MPIIKLETPIHAPIDICFDLSTSIDLHSISTQHTYEKAIGGKMHGLIGLNETVTWEAIHFGIKQQLTSIISEFERPYYFVDEQINGPFAKLHHRHTFEKKDNYTMMTDEFLYESPFGIVGKIFNKIILTAYLTHFLAKRNAVIKDYAESNKWMTILKKAPSNLY